MVESKIEISTYVNMSKQIAIKNIPKGTYFTGAIDMGQVRSYRKGSKGTIMDLDSGDTCISDDTVVDGYTVCDIEIILKPHQ